MFCAPPCTFVVSAAAAAVDIVKAVLHKDRILKKDKIILCLEKNKTKVSYIEYWHVYSMFSLSERYLGI